MFLKLIADFLENKFQSVILNGQTSSWEPVLAGLPQVSVLGSLLFLIYINDLLKNVSSRPKHFADDTFIFFTVKNVNLSTDQLNSDLNFQLSQLKMLFSPDPKKQGKEVIFF